MRKPSLHLRAALRMRPRRFELRLHNPVRLRRPVRLLVREPVRPGLRLRRVIQVPLARTAAAILILTGAFWIAAAWHAADRGPTVTRKPPPAFASGGRHRAAPDAG